MRAPLSASGRRGFVLLAGGKSTLFSHASNRLAGFDNVEQHDKVEVGMARPVLA
jgi:hypothetical protein